MPNIAQKCLPIVLSTLLCSPIFACKAEIIGVGKISQTELITQIDNQQAQLILDIRSKKEYDKGHIPGAVNIEFRKLKESIDMIASSKDIPIVVYCERGIRAAVAEMRLQEAGFQTILHLEGDMSAWRKNALPVTKS